MVNEMVLFSVNIWFVISAVCGVSCFILSIFILNLVRNEKLDLVQKIINIIIILIILMFMFFLIGIFNK